MREDLMRADALDLVDEVARHVRTREHHPELDEIHVQAQAFKEKWSRVGNAVNPDDPDQPATPLEP